MLEDGTLGRASVPRAPRPAATRRWSCGTATRHGIAARECGARSPMSTRSWGRQSWGSIPRTSGPWTPRSSPATARGRRPGSGGTRCSRSRWPPAAPPPRAVGCRSTGTSPSCAGADPVIPMPMVNMISGGLHAGRQPRLPGLPDDPARRRRLPRGAGDGDRASSSGSARCVREGAHAAGRRRGGLRPAAADQRGGRRVDRRGHRRARASTGGASRSTSPPPTSTTPIGGTYAPDRRGAASSTQPAWSRCSPGGAATTRSSRSRTAWPRTTGTAGPTLDPARRSIQLIGDDLFATQASRLRRGIAEGAPTPC